MLLLSWLIAIAVTLSLLDAAVGARRIRNLRDIQPLTPRLPGGENLPLVSVIVAARNEERGIEAGVRSLLALAYPSLEVIIVNDRSTDGTAAILERVRQSDPRLVVVTVDGLPPGWLGKNHALAMGAAARGDILLFTDADVVFEPSTIGRAVRFMEDERLDHLAALPDVRLQGVALTALVLTFGVLFSNLHASVEGARSSQPSPHRGWRVQSDPGVGLPADRHPCRDRAAPR